MAKNTVWYAIGFIVLVFIAGVYTGYIPVKIPSAPGLGPGCGSGTHLDTASGQCVPDATGGVPIVPGSTVPYGGTVDWIVTSKDGDSKAALALTNAVFWALKRDGSYQGTPAQATSTTVYFPGTDQGHAILCVLYKTSTVGYVDAPKTVAQNPAYMKEGYYLKDVDTDGKLDQCYPIDVTGDPNFQVTTGAGPPQQNPDLTIDLIAWNADTSVTPTNINSPTGMNAAGDYHATGYVAAITSTYAMNVVRVYANVVQSGTGAVNSTANGFWTKLQAGTTYFKGFTLKGVGGQGGTYGFSVLSNEFATAYNSGDQHIIFWSAHDPNTPSKIDISQPNYGMLFVQERLSGTTWLQYDIWVSTSGDLTASSWYYLYFKIDTINPAGTTSTNSLTLTLTG